jgi:hypothetical protein
VKSSEKKWEKWVAPGSGKKPERPWQRDAMERCSERIQWSDILDGCSRGLY